ncbi:MAG: hypothetical protein EOP06_11230 [Proteobacteria bacterium]|nr:MAG: hypothetical protein EOP06_11230 [Pseudomonadota bacterium]
MKTTETRLEEIRREGYDLDFSETFNTAFEVYKRTALIGGLAILVFFIVLIAIGFGIGVVMVGATATTKLFTDLRMENFSLVGQIIYIVSMCIIAGLSNPFSASLIKMCEKADMGDDVSVGDAFICYKAPYFAPLFVEAILVSAVTVTISQIINGLFPFNIAMSLVGTLISLLISFFMLMAAPLIIFGKLNAIEAIKGSIVVVGKSPWVILGLVIVGGMLSLVGLIGLCIGIVFTAPFMSSTYYAIYKNSVGVDDGSEIDEIGTQEYDY